MDRIRSEYPGSLSPENEKLLEWLEKKFDITPKSEFPQYLFQKYLEENLKISLSSSWGWLEVGIWIKGKKISSASILTREDSSDL